MRSLVQAKGDSVLELERAGIDGPTARRLSIPVDPVRASALGSNVLQLHQFLAWRAALMSAKDGKRHSRSAQTSHSKEEHDDVAPIRIRSEQSVAHARSSFPNCSTCMRYDLVTTPSR